MTTKTRILGLCTALSGIADNIDASLDCLTDTIDVDLSQGQSAVPDSDEHCQSGDSRVDVAIDLDAPEPSLYDVETAELLDNDPLDENRNVDTVAESQSMLGNGPDHISSGLDPVPWINGQQINVMSTHSFLSPTTLMQTVNRTQPSSDQMYTEFIDHEVARWPHDANQSERARPNFPFFTSGSPSESMKFPLVNVGFPPGVASFPSTFSAHLAVCEYFTKQNQAYRDRLQIGGKES